MELTKNIVERITLVDRRHLRFRQIFVRFIEKAQYLAEPDSPIKGIKLEASTQEDLLKVSFGGIQVRFLLVVCYGDDGSPRGKVVCSRAVRNLSDTIDFVGSFTFSGQGITDFDFAQGDEDIEMEYHAIEIVLHFLNAAITMPLPRMLEQSPRATTSVK